VSGGDPGLVYEDPAPHWCAQLPEEERSQRVTLAGDFCELDGERFFVRGELQLPIFTSEEVLALRVWVVVPTASYVRVADALESGRAEPEAPFRGYLATELAPAWPSTLDLAAMVHPRSEGRRPLVVLEPAEHPLFDDQSEGITEALAGQQLGLLAQRG
jgi:hypothetical protein